MSLYHSVNEFIYKDIRGVCSASYKIHTLSMVISLELRFP